MKTIKIPYHTSEIELHIDESRIKAVLTPNVGEYKTEASQEEILRAALKSPLGTKRLGELSKEAQKVVIVTSDHTRAMPSKITLPILLEEIRSSNPSADITILIATGLHRPTTKQEQRSMFGDSVVDNEHIAVNDSTKDEDFELVCNLPSGAELWVNKIALHCDLLITEGFVEPHFFAGYSGGRKSILPGICHSQTVKENHSYRAIASPYSTAGVLENNPIHRDMVHAARAVNVQFTLSVALDGNKQIIAAFAGDIERSHEAGVGFVRELSKCKATTGDIVVTSNGGYPLDQNLYQCPKAVSTAAMCCREGGVIVMCAGCADGMGGANFKRLRQMGTPEEIDGYLSKIPPRESIPEQWCAQIFSRILKKHKVIIVTDMMDHELLKQANMIPAATIEEAMDMAYTILGQDAQVVIIPDGVAVLAVR